MKKILITLAMLSIVFSTTFAEDNIELRKECQTNQGPGTGPRSLSPNVTASLDGGIVNVGVEGYDGNISIIIYDNIGIPVCMDSELVVGYSLMQINISGLSYGTYCIMIIVGNENYVGTFTL